MTSYKGSPGSFPTLDNWDLIKKKDVTGTGFNQNSSCSSRGIIPSVHTSLTDL